MRSTLTHRASHVDADMRAALAPAHELRRTNACDASRARRELGRRSVIRAAMPRKDFGATQPPPLKSQVDAPRAGTIFYADEDGFVEEQPLGRRDSRPVLRIGAEAQTLPPPEGKLVSEKKMKRVAFECSSVDVRDAPASDGLPEIALIGRSNVGKSSLLNLMTFGAGAAAVSAKPGTTISMNHYLVDRKWRLVDLPGYGYAKADQDAIAAWDVFTKEYFVQRETLAGVLLLVDASIPPTKNDEAYANWLIEHDTPFTLVFTKCDRDKPGQPSVEENKASLRAKLEAKWHRLPSMISTSSVTTEGREEVLKFISSLILFRRIRAEERKKAKRREKQRLIKDERYEAKGRAMGRAPTKRPANGKTSKSPVRAEAPAKKKSQQTVWGGDDDEDDDDDDDDWDDDDDNNSFAMRDKGKGQKSIQDMIKAELAELRREG